MNWTGGSKSRFKNRSEIHWQKASFHQQRRLVLAESAGETHVGNTSAKIDLKVQPTTAENDLFDDGDKTSQIPLTPFAFIKEDSQASELLFNPSPDEKEPSTQKETDSWRPNNSPNYSPTSDQNTEELIERPASSASSLQHRSSSPKRVPDAVQKPPPKKRFLQIPKNPFCHCRVIRVVRKVKIRDAATQTEQ